MEQVNKKADMIHIKPARAKKGNTILVRIFMHLLLIVFGFTGTLLFLFFGTMVLAGRRNHDNLLVKEIISWLFDTPIHYVLLCTMGAIVLNVVFFYKNRRKNIIQEFSIDFDTALFFFKTQQYYSNTIYQKSYSFDSVWYKESKNTYFLSSKRYNIYTFFSNTSKIGLIDCSDLVWDKELKLIVYALSYINKELARC